MIKTVYHVFADNVDLYLDTKEEAYQEYARLCQEREDVRLWTLLDDGEDIEDGDCLEAKGAFPR